MENSTSTSDFNSFEEIIKDDLIDRHVCYEVQQDGAVVTVCEQDKFDDLVGWGIHMSLLVIIIYLLYTRDSKFLY